MKRWVSGAMAFIITFSCAQGGFALATEGSGAEAVNTQLEARAEIGPEAAGDDETVVFAEAAEGDAPEAVPAEAEFTLGEDEPAAADEAGEAPEAEAAAPRYAEVSAESTEVRADPEGDVVATLYAGAAVLLLAEDADWAKIAFNTERGVVTGFAAAGALRAMDAGEASAYLDALAEDAVVALYEGRLDAPLALVPCAFADAGEAEPDGESSEEPADETDEEPAGETAGRDAEEVSDPAEDAGRDDPAEAPAETADDAAQADGTSDEIVVAFEQESASVIAEATAASETNETAETAAAAMAMQLNAQSLVLGLKESYSALAVTGGSGVTWSTSNAKVVKVDAQTGVVKGVRKGSATVTATAADGQTASVKVTVKAAPKKAKFSPAKLSLGEGGKTAQLKLKLTKGSASAGTTYASSNEAVATVDQSGVVTTHSAGAAVITARTYNKKKATCKVTVYAEPAPAAIKLPAKATIGLKETRAQLAVTLVPAEGQSTSTADITWSSSNKKIVKVNAKTGAIKGVKKGTATIVARTANGLKAKCKVTVKKAPTKVTLKPAASSTTVGGTVQFTAKLSKGSAGGCTFLSSNTAVATIDEKGLATALSAGQTTITVTTFNGKKAKTTLTVKASGSTADTSVDVPESMAKLGIASYQSTYSNDMTNAEKLEYVIYNAQTQLGKPYKYGSGYKTANPSGFDCSGFVYWCFYKLGIELGESAYKQGYDSRYAKISDIASLKRGDVVCFNTSNDSDLSDHTGIYLGDGYFIHASSGSSKRKVIVQRLYDDSISSDYYKRNFSWGRRILN